MKHSILLLVFFSLCSVVSAQINYDEEHEGESFSLNSTLNSNKNYHYTASDSIVFKSGFNYTPLSGKKSLFEIDPMVIYPPTDGYTGGPNVNDNGVVGSIGGTVNISALGGAIYSIPIDVLPGKDGIQPALSITYNSQANNGLLGYGWNLTGLSAITRCGRTIYHDETYTSDAVDYADDRFMLDGQRLLSISDNLTFDTIYGANGCRYRTEIDNISRIISYGGDGQNPEKFKVWTKDGHIIEYGYTADSKLLHSSDSVAIWMINKISDYNGNYMTYNYITTNNSCHINHIDYTGCGSVLPMYSVTFDYIDRDDEEYYYLYNQRIVSDVLLGNISMKYCGSEVYKYTLTYDTISPANGRFYSRLQSIFLEQNGIHLNPTKIVWGDYEQQCYTQTQPITNNIIKDVCYAGDFNGDGIDDIISFQYIFGVRGEGKCLYGNGDNTFSNTPVTINTGSITHVSPCDINGDGLCDLLTFTRGTFSNNKYIVYLHYHLATNDGTGFTNRHDLGYYVAPNNIEDYVQVGDFLGNGKNDILVLSYSNSGTNNQLYATLVSCNPYDNDFSIVFQDKFVRNHCSSVVQGDFNGDGRIELILTDGTASYTYSVNSDNLSLLRSSGFPTAWHKCLPGDFNGDGKTDLLTWAENANPRWHISISTTDGFYDQWGVTSDASFPSGAPKLSGASLINASDNYAVYSVNIYDADGDGKSDVVFVFNNKVVVYYAPISLDAGNNNCSFIKTVTINNATYNNPYYLHLFEQNYLGYNIVGKFNNDSYYSLMLRNNPTTPGQYLMESFDNQYKQNLVKSITNGMGNSVTFHYDYFTNPEFYTISEGGRFVNVNDRVRKLMIPLRALYSITSENISGTIDTTRYYYEDMYYHMTGRGILGFKKTIKTNTTTGIKTVNINRYAGTNRNNVPLPYLEPDSTIIYLVSGNDNIPVKIVSSDYIIAKGKQILHQKAPVSIQPESVKVQNYEINGHPINLEITEYDYDNSISGNVQKYGYNNITHIRKGYTTEPIMYANYCPFIEKTDIEYNNIVSNDSWLVSRMAKNTKRSYFRESGHLTDSIKNSICYAYNSSYPYLLEYEQINPGDSSNSKLVVKTEYSYSFSDGNISNIEKEITAPNDISITPRTTAIEYGPQYHYRFASTTTNSLNHSFTAEYDTILGRKVSDTDCNGLTYSYTDDFFGVDSESVSPDGVRKHLSKRWSSSHNDAPQNSLYYTWTRSSGSYPSITFYHKTGVPLRNVNRSVEGKVIYTDLEYDSKNNLYRKSLPYEAGTTPAGYIVYSYDGLNRNTMTEYPDGTRDEVVYNGDEISYIHHDSYDVSSQTTTEKHLPNGWLEKTTDSGGNIVKYDYNCDGTLRSSYVEGSNSAVLLAYNSAGMRIGIEDPDYGCMLYSYNALGELVSQTNPKNVVTRYTYDVLGRMNQRIVKIPGKPYETTMWKYNTTLSGHLGTLDSITFNSNSQIISYQYDSLQRVVQSNETYDNVTYSTSYAYDIYGRVVSEIYPSGFQIKNMYNYGGYLCAIKDSDDNTLWKADTHDLYGHLTSFHTGNGLTTNRNYDVENGRILNIVTNDGVNNLQNYSYTYDDFGNFASRTKNIGTMLQENFTYDDFNRLTRVETNHVTFKMEYDRFGCMLSKSQDGFAFNGAIFSINHPNAIERAQTYSLPPFGGQDITYTHFDKVRSIIMGFDEVFIDYGYDRQRIRMTETIGGHERIKTYIGNCEFIQPDTGEDYSLTYLSSTDGVFAVAESSENGYQLHFIHTDNLGSWDIITDMGGSLEQSLSFDAWGNRRNADTWTGPALDEPLFDRGFTGHEHLYNFGLINMNGRVYDPFMSTFLSPDNHIQAPDNSQNFNRYAYCLNNPLKYTDPDGEFSLLATWISGFVQGLFSTGSNRLSAGWDRANQLVANEVKILGGLFKTDSNKRFWGRTWEFLSRFTWQALQTTLGYSFTRFSNFVGQVDDVNYYGGATAASGNFFNQDGAAVTLGNYINGSRELFANPHNSLFQHEFGHYLQSQEMGPTYLIRVGLPSLFSSHNHDFHPIEQDANRRAFLYFNKYVDGFYKSEDAMYEDYGWDFNENPLNINNNNTYSYVDYHDSNSLKQLNRLTIHSKWYDYVSLLTNPQLFLLNGIFNSIYYNYQY